VRWSQAESMCFQSRSHLTVSEISVSLSISTCAGYGCGCG
jgi:hypothetical protein